MSNHRIAPPTETHPLSPFIPPHARVFMLGSFPPPSHRWRMPFYYPNFNNDMWRIFGLVFFDDKQYFIDEANRGFYQAKIEQFLSDTGIAISDTAYQIKRLADNAADKHLHVITPMDIGKMLQQMPHCHAIIITGEKAGEILWQHHGDPASQPPKVGQRAPLIIHHQPITVYRLPSSSRAYPLTLIKKAEIYRQVFWRLGFIS